MLCMCVHFNVVVEHGYHFCLIVWRKKCDLHLKMIDQHENQKARAFAIIIGYCKNLMKHWAECLSNLMH